MLTHQSMLTHTHIQLATCALKNSTLISRCNEIHILFPVTGLFGLDPASGSVFMRRSLEGVREPVFQLQVEARDGGFPPMVARAVVTVIVEDPNGYTGQPRFLYPPQDGTVVKVPEVRTSSLSWKFCCTKQQIIVT